MKLRGKIENLVLPHRNFNEVRRQLVSAFGDVLGESRSRIYFVVGPSRAGKSMAVDTALGDIKRDPAIAPRLGHVLRARMSESATNRSLSLDLLAALKMPGLPRTAAALSLFLRNRLIAGSYLAIVIDESNHAVEQSARVSSRAVGDYLKNLVDGTGVSIILIGLPRLLKLLEDNEQLDGRAEPPLILRPYSPDASDLVSFGECVKEYADLFQSSGCPFTFDLDELICNCYLASGGSIGLLSKFMWELADWVEDRKSGAVSYLVATEFAKKLCDPGLVDQRASPRVRVERFSRAAQPFHHKSVNDAHMSCAYKHMLRLNGIDSI